MESTTKKEPVNKQVTGITNTVSTKKVFGDMIKFTWVVVLGILILLTFYAPIHQIIYWLKYGVWKSLPAGSFLIRILPTSILLWLSDETSWIGVKKILFWILNLHISIFLIPVLIFMGYLYAIIEDVFETAESPKQKSVKNGNFKKPKNV